MSLSHAKRSGGRLSASRSRGSAPALSSARTDASQPYFAARCSGVTWRQPLLFARHCFLSRRETVSPVSSCVHAYCKGVKCRRGACGGRGGTGARRMRGSSTSGRCVGVGVGG